MRTETTAIKTESLTDAQLDRLVAEKVMGWTVKESAVEDDIRDGPFPFYDAESSEFHTSPFRGRKWNPLISDGDCWQVVDKLVSDDFVVAVESYNGNRYWKCFIKKLRQYEPQGLCIDSNRRRAILMAALRAVGEQV